MCLPAAANLVAAHRANALVDELVAVAQFTVELEQARHLIAGLVGEADHRADLSRPGFGQLGHTRHQNVRDLLEIHAALGGGHARPGTGVERLARGGDGRVHISRGRFEIGEDGFLVMRRDDLQLVAAAALAPIAIDKKLRRAPILDALDGLVEIFHAESPKNEH